MSGVVIETGRLVLRTWHVEDLEPFHAICSDPQVMATLGPPLSRDETAALIARVTAQEAENGHTFWALERKEDARLIGWSGVIRGNTGPVDGKAEIGWRLARDCWGSGFATEAARASLDWLFASLQDDAAWAITSQGNLRSRAVMERLGMVYQADLDFDHQGIAESDPLRRHVTYRLARQAWNA